MKTSSALFKKISLFFVIMGIVALVFITFFGMTISSSGMQMNEKGQMPGCLFNGYLEICTITFSEYIQKWQNVFTALPSKMTYLAFALLLAGLTFIGSFIGRKICYIHNRGFQIFNFLKEAFSRGILNPKIY